MGTQAFSKSQFYMWRAVIAIAHADGTIQEEERGYLNDIFASLDRVYALSNDQKRVFAEDLKEPQKIEDMVAMIDDPQFRGMLITFGETIAWADGEVTADEDAVLQKLHADQMASIDADKLRAEVKEGQQQRREEFVAEQAQLREEVRGNNKLFSAIDRLLMKMGIDILKD